MPSDPHQVAARAIEHVTAQPPTLGAGRLVCVDGPAGSGKTTLAAALAALVPDAQVVHCDEMLQGWRGLPGLAESVERLVAPMVSGGAGAWRRWDWAADGWAEWHSVAPGGLLVLEGVGCWSPAIASLVGCLVWVEADPDVRLARGMARDGEAMRPQWLQWRLDEDELFARLGTRERADLVVSTDT